MQVLTWDLCGKMAHFRKYYSNSTALSHYLPPVTTVKGMIAGLLGWERDSYYALLANRHCAVAVGVVEPLKKITQTMNLLKVEGLRDLSGDGKNRTQNDTEWVVPVNIRQSSLRYRIWFHHEDAEVMENLARRICPGGLAYCSAGISLALGAAQCLAWIEAGKWVEASKVATPLEPTPLASAIPVRDIERLDYTGLAATALIKEETLLDFAPGRYIVEGGKIDILLAPGQHLPVVLRPATELWSAEGEQFIFLR